MQLRIEHLTDNVQEAMSNLPGISFELVWVASMFIYWTPYVIRKISNKRYSKSHHFPQPILILHALVSFAEVLTYHAKLWNTGVAPEPTLNDVILCIVQSLTSLYMASKIHHQPKAALEVTCATFQCMALQRLLATGLAVYLESAMWHKASIKLLNNFIWARIFILQSRQYIAGLDTHTKRYAAGIVGCHLMGIYEGDYTYGIGIYIGLMTLLLSFDKWAQNLDSRWTSGLVEMGFVTRPEKPQETGKSDNLLNGSGLNGTLKQNGFTETSK
ncbi:hypothetical protein ACJ41O_001769 [Fusarium nematophilum]